MAGNKKVTSTKKSNTKSTSIAKNKKTAIKKVSTNNKQKKSVKTNSKKVNTNNGIKKNVKTNKQSTVEKIILNDKKVNESVEDMRVSDTTVKEKFSFKKKIVNFLGKVSIKNKKEKNKVVKTSKKVKAKREKVSFKKKLSDFFGKFKKNDKINKSNNKNKAVKKNLKKNNSKVESEFVFTKKTKRIFIGLAIVCLLVLIVEGVLLIVHKINIDKNTVYYDAINSLVIDGTDIVAVGSSNFRYSKDYDYTNGLEKGKLIKYDKNGKIVFEKMFETGINTTFSSIISVDDGYVVVGSGVFSEDELKEEANEGFILKYDKEGKLVWEKFFHDLTNTKFNKVIEISDGYIVVGQSIYANMEMGNHTTGGGIIIKYDKDGNEVWSNNHGGTKSGNFNDVVEVNGNLYVAGKDAVDSGNIVKYDKDGKYKWHKNYSYTDGLGFTGIAYLDNQLYVVGSKKILPSDLEEGASRSTTNTDALIVVYDLEGKKKFEKTYGGSNYERYNSVLNYRNEIYVVGHTTSKDAGFKNITDGELMTGLVVRYDSKGNILKKDIFGGSNNDNLTDIYTDGVCLYISGYSNSKDGNIITSKNNGKDYFGKVIKLDFKFRTLLIK